MDGGDVRPGRQTDPGQTQVKRIGTIESDDFYIYNFPGSMEISPSFGRTSNMKTAWSRRLEMRRTSSGRTKRAPGFLRRQEPNLKWQGFADCLFALVKQVGVTRIIFHRELRRLGAAHARAAPVWSSRTSICARSCASTACG